MVRLLEKGITMKQCLYAGGIVVAALALSVSFAGESLKSGIAVGGSCSPFHPLNITGPHKDNKQCLV